MKSTYKELIATAPSEMACADKEGWAKGKANNTDPYGKRIYSYAEDWARLMEGQISQGKTVIECADAMSHLADTDGITGFMYGAAVAILRKGWKHGEELGKWHNRQYMKDEAKADAAAIAGKIVNPAIITVNVP